MSYSCGILADSVAPNGVRLTTMQVTFPRFILAEFNTHRMLSRNSASSRAIPVEKMLERVRQDPFEPAVWESNKAGMQGGEPLDKSTQNYCHEEWMQARDDALDHAERLQALGVHKSITNRLLEPFLWHTVIVTATEWDNFFALRCHPAAQPQFQTIARMMRSALHHNLPAGAMVGFGVHGGWHLPLVPDYAMLVASGLTAHEVAAISCARCARVSYLTHEGKREPIADLQLAERLRENGHMSPFEHAAVVTNNPEALGVVPAGDFIGNFRAPWVQYRKMLPGESVFHGGEK